MRRSHWEQIQPVCPLCLRERQKSFALNLGRVGQEEEGIIWEGILHCSNPQCQFEYPIIDGIPFLVPDLLTHISNQLLSIISRTDLSSDMLGVLSDCCGPGSQFDTTRQHLSSYAWDHYADLDPDEPKSTVKPGSMLRLLHQIVPRMKKPTEGPILDLGCSVGRSTFTLSEQSQRLVLGVDLNFAMLRLAMHVLRHNEVIYPRRQIGIVYEQRQFPVFSFSRSEQVDFWACDALALPFKPETFSAIVGLNILDCVSSPCDLLTSMAQLTKRGGSFAVASPYDWSASATAVESWIGGHSQRSQFDGAAEPLLRALLTPNAHPQSMKGVKILSELENCPWSVRLHERSVLHYEAHAVIVERLEK